MSSQYYLGIAGEQTGPFTEQELRAKIRSAEVPEDALVWHDAMDDWKSLRAVPELWEHFKAQNAKPAKASPAKRKAPPKKPAALAAHDFQAIATFATSDTSLEPAFRSDGKPSKKRRGTVGIQLGGNAKRVGRFLVLVVILGAAGFFFVSGDDFLVGGSEGADVSASTEEKSNIGFGDLVRSVGLGGIAESLGLIDPPAPAATPVPNPLEMRRKELKKAQEDIMVNPEAALAELRKIIQIKNDDAIARDATDAAVNYLQSVRRYTEAGKLLLETKRPEEAVTMFLEPPTVFDEADKAMMAAADATKEEERRKWIVKSLDLLLESKAEPKIVEERVRLLEKEFPSNDHPYRYYLKSDDEKVADIFNRLSFSFVQSLLQFIATEFPQLTLQARPTLAVVREGADKYRLVGRYNGSVRLSRDVLPNVKFVFWGHGANWYLVETDVTDDRRRFAAGERKRRSSATFTANELLVYLESLFRARYPGTPLHETQEAAEKRRASASE